MRTYPEKKLFEAFIKMIKINQTINQRIHQSNKQTNNENKTTQMTTIKQKQKREKISSLVIHWNLQNCKWYSLIRTFRKRPPKMPGLGGRGLWEVIACKSLGRNESKYYLIRIWQLPRLNPWTNADAMFYSCNGQCQGINPVLPFEQCPFFLYQPGIRELHNTFN